LPIPSVRCNRKITRTPWITAAITLAAVAGCGTEDEPSRAAAPQTIEIGSKDFDGENGVGFALEVRRLHITANSWRVDARIVNRTGVSWTVSRPHFPGRTKFGIYVAPTAEELSPARLEASRLVTPQLAADRFRPLLPHVFAAGTGWTGSFSGRGRIPQNSFVKFAFGRFTTYDPHPRLPPRILLLTSRPVQVK
jgi:hypothetical protein